MWDWKRNEGKTTSHSNLQLRFSERSLDLVRGFLVQFGLIWNVWLPWVLIWLKIGHCKARNVKLVGQWRKSDVTQQLQNKIFSTVFRYSLKGFFSVWCNLRSLASMGTHLSEKWPLLNKECHMGRATTEKWCHTSTSN